ncbi:hypothetical protein RB595_008554 [Gaeumannomyces hyphopodioides]
MQLFTLALSAGAALASVQLGSHMRAVLPALAARDVQTINNVVTDTDSRIKELTAAINGFNGDPAQLLTASSNMLGSLNKGVTDITATSPISLNDAVTLQGTITGLQNDGNALIKALSDKKTAFENAGLCEVVFKQAGDMGDVAKKLIDAVVQKVPQEVQQLAAQVSGSFTDTLKQSQQTFAPGNCTNRQGSATNPGAGGASAGGAAGTGTGNASSGNPGMPVTAGAAAGVAPLALCIAAAALAL